MKAAIYARAHDQHSIESQLLDLRDLATRKGYTISDKCEFIDDNVSGRTLDRPALSQLREMVKTHAIDMVLVDDPDRLSRNLAHQLLLTKEFEKAGVRLEFLTTPTENTPEGRLLLDVKGVIAEYERETIRERMMRGKKEKARRATAT